VLEESLLTGVMSFLDRHPRASRLLRPLAFAPVLSNRLKVLPRAWMGATAFELHDVDLERGRIGIGGVDEIMWSSKFLGLFHDLLGERLGELAKNEVLYEVGREGGRWEIEQARSHGRWAPAMLMRLIDRPNVLQELRSDPSTARFFELCMKMAMRLIINEGGWGTVEEIELSSTPLRIVVGHSKEAEWGHVRDGSACWLSAGVVAGYATGLLREELDAREVECRAAGAEHCVFELDARPG